MSFNPNTYPAVQYSGTPTFQSIQLRPQSSIPRVVPLTFDWSIYFAKLAGAAPNIMVPINLTGNTPLDGILDRIACVKIDNTNSNVPVSVQALDTGDLVTCPPQSVVTELIVTNGLQVNVIAQGLSAGNLPTTKVYLFNFYCPPSSNPQINETFPQWLGTPSIQEGNSSILGGAYGSPVLGDNTQQALLNLGLFNPVQLFGGPQPSGVIVITNMQVTVFNLIVNVARVSNSRIRSTTDNFVLYNFYYFAAGVNFSNVVPAYQASAKQTKIDATKNWVFENNDGGGGIVNGTAVCYLDYTWVP